MTSVGSASDILFKGLDGSECEEFIAAIEELAFAEGWSRDRERMLLFARSRLRNKALRWFARLDASKKNDWDSFVEALFDQYPQVEAPEVEITTPMWSATTFSPGASTVILPSDQGMRSQSNARDEGQDAENRKTLPSLPNLHAYNASTPGHHIGILRVVTDEGSAPPQYVWHGHRQLYYPDGATSRPRQQEQLGITINRQEALVVCFLQSTEPHAIGCLNTTYYLGDLSLSFHPGDFSSYEIRAASGVTKPSGNNYAQNVSMVWNVLEGGTVQATLSEFDPQSRDYRGTYIRKEDFRTSEVHFDTSGASISFVKPGTRLPQGHDGSYVGRSKIKARMVFEPL